MRAAAASRLPENVLLFCRTLRAAGIPAGPAQLVEALQALSRVGLTGREDVRIALRACLISDPVHFDLFDQAFRLFFRKPGSLERLLRVLMSAGDGQGESPGRLSPRFVEAWSPGGEAGRLGLPAGHAVQAGGYSHAERLRQKDFDAMSPAEQRAAAELLRSELKPLDEIRSRRFRAHPLGDRPDPRRTFRLMTRQGGQVLRIARMRRRSRPPVLVLLCDVSGSMTAYSRMFLQFAHALTRRLPTVHCFVFGTRLSNVSRHLDQSDGDRALALVAASVDDWDGGTRIAACLRRFNRDWGRRVLAGNAVVLLLSDGLERDTNSDLEFQAARLHRSCRQLIWLNPMLRYDKFQPRAYGIRTLLPQVDRFLPAHNVASLSALVCMLADHRQGARRRMRR